MARDSGIVLYEGKEISLFGKMKTCEGVVAALGNMKTSREGILCPLWDTKLGLIVKFKELKDFGYLAQHKNMVSNS